MMFKNFMSYLKNIFIGILFIASFSCEPLDLKRVMDTNTGQIEISGTTVTVHGTLLDVGNSGIVSHGHCWSKSHAPTVEDSFTDLGEKDQTGEFSSNLFGLVPGQTHYVRSYVYNGAEYSYGEELSFEITAADIQFNSFEVSKLDEIGSISVTSVTNGVGSINFDQHGHCWSQTDPPTINDFGISELGELISDTSFTSQIDDLTMGVYYIRGYLEAEGSVIYTETVVYESTISVETGIVNVNPNNTAIASGEVNSLGVRTIVDHGHCWSTITSDPDFNNQHSTLGSTSSLGVFNSNIEDLISGRTYYIRAYAFDGSNYYYGEIRSFIAN